MIEGLDASELILKELLAMAPMDIGQSPGACSRWEQHQNRCCHVLNSDRYCHLKMHVQCSNGGTNGNRYLCIVKRHFRFRRQDLLPLFFQAISVTVRPIVTVLSNKLI